MVYTFNVMLLVQIYGVCDVWHVRTLGDGTLDMRTRIRPADWCAAAEDCRWQKAGSRLCEILNVTLSDV